MELTIDSDGFSKWAGCFTSGKYYDVKDPHGGRQHAGDGLNDKPRNGRALLRYSSAVPLASKHRQSKSLHLCAVNLAAQVRVLRRHEGQAWAHSTGCRPDESSTIFPGGQTSEGRFLVYCSF